MYVCILYICMYTVYTYDTVIFLNIYRWQHMHASYKLAI